MKIFKNCPLLVGVAAISVILSIISYACQSSAYSEYSETLDFGSIPHIALVFKGLSDGVYPWSKPNAGGDDLFVDGENELSQSDSLAGGELASIDIGEETESDINAIVDDSLYVTENSVSSNDSFEDTVSENDAEKVYEFTAVDADYFNDALFIGDSRTVGLSEYCKELDERATFYAKVSLTIFKVLNTPFVKTEDNDKITVEQALSENQFAKIYIMLGLNEIGTGTPEYFANAYADVIAKIRELQPDAIIYIQGIMHVTEAKSSKDKYFNNENIDIRNEAIAQLANGQDIFYLDMNESVDDENGNLLAELTFDDVHLKASSYQRWYDYLLGHAIVKQ